MTEQVKKYLDARSTPFILQAFRLTKYNHHIGWCNCPDAEYYPDRLECIGVNIGKNSDGIMMSIGTKDLREYLATRPHVMNKKESRQSRIARKKSGKSRKK